MLCCDESYASLHGSAVLACVVCTTRTFKAVHIGGTAQELPEATRYCMQLSSAAAVSRLGAQVRLFVSRSAAVQIHSRKGKQLTQLAPEALTLH